MRRRPVVHGDKVAAWHARAPENRYLVPPARDNVGGRNKVRWRLRELLESLGKTKVSTYIASGK